MSDKLFLKILNAALHGEKFKPDAPLSREDIHNIFALAELHRVLPLVLDAMYGAVEIDEDMLYTVKQRVKLLVLGQTLRTQCFLDLYQMLRKAGFEPAVVKGIVCRSLYPTPDYRTSSDEDMYIPKQQYLDCISYLKKIGFREVAAFDEKHYESAFVNDEGMYIELHKSLFPLSSEYFEKYNRIFSGVYDRSEYIEVDSVSIRTLSPTDHMLYLIMHSLKHFIRSGVGIRQICDIAMFAQAYSRDIDWEYVHRCCEIIDAVKYATAVFNIGSKYLGLDADKVGCFKFFDSASVDEVDLLSDILTAGLYGNTDKGRAHSSSVTLRAVQGKKETVLSKAFPSVSSIDRRFSYVRRCPILLPVAWVHRLVLYLGEASKSRGNTPARSMKIGEQRIRLLKEYGLIKNDFK